MRISTQWRLETHGNTVKAFKDNVLEASVLGNEESALKAIFALEGSPEGYEYVQVNGWVIKQKDNRE